MLVPTLRLITGHVSETTAKIWVRGSATHNTAKVTILDEHNTLKSEEVKLSSKNGYVNVIEFDQLRADTRHTSTLTLISNDGSKNSHARGGFTTAPLASKNQEEFYFLLCSCNKGGRESDVSPFYHLERRRQTLDAKFTIHAGDNIYYDGYKPNSGKRPTFKRYADTYEWTWGRDLDARQVLTEAANYMVMDDHDIYNNFNTDERLWGYARELFVDVGLPAYKAFQHNHNPHSYGDGDKDNAPLYYNFSWGNAKFFAMDVRMEREPDHGRMISQQQLDDFKEWVLKHKSKMKFVITAVPILVGSRTDGSDKWNGDAYRTQRNEVLEFLAENKTSVVFLTGDMHASYHSTMHVYDKVNNKPAVVLHEIMSSPLDHWLRGRPGLDVLHYKTDRYDFDGHMSHFAAEKSAMSINVEPNTGSIYYQAFSVTSEPNRLKILFSDDFKI